MAEYMDYNDDKYSFKSKRQKRVANIRFIIAVLFIVAVVIWTIVRVPKNVRSNFGPVYSSVHTVGEKKAKVKNEFLKFSKNYEYKQNVNDDDSFKKAYSQIYGLIHKSKLEISKDKVYSFDENGVFTIAKVYVINRQTNSKGDYYDAEKSYVIGETGVDFYVFNYDTTNGFTLSSPQKFSIHYYSKINEVIPYLCKTNVASESFKLNFYKLGINVKTTTAVNNAKTNLLLNAGMTKSEADNDYFFKKISFLNAKNQEISIACEKAEDSTVGDTELLCNYALNTPSADFTISMVFDDTMYNKFNAISVAKIAGAKYKIVVN